MSGDDDEYELVEIAGIDVVAGPRRPGRLLQRRVGTLAHGLAPMIVTELVAQLGLPYAAERRILALGPHLAAADHSVWGSDPALGDPALLLGGLRSGLTVRPPRQAGVTIIVDPSEATSPADRRRALDPGSPLEKVVRRIAASELVISSSPQAVIVAEALGVPARGIIATGAEHVLDDHYRATGRDPEGLLAASLEEAVERGGVAPPVWDPYPLLDAFPAELWGEDADPTLLAAIGWRARLAIALPAESSGPTIDV